MTIMKKYFLCALILNTVSLFGMLDFQYEEYVFSGDYGSMLSSEETVCSRKIRDTIDQNHLGIGKFTCCRSFLGSIKSYYKTTLLSKEIAAKEIERIESYISSYINKISFNINRKTIFKRLVEKHWYVNYVVQVLIKEKIKEFEAVKGSTLDQLYTPDFSNDINGVNEMVYNKAHESFFKDMHRKNEVEILLLPFTDIHFTALYGHTNKINPSSLIMSSDSAYLKSKDIDNKKIVWEMKTGAQVYLTNKKIEWSSGYVPPYMQPCAIDKNDRYYATSINTAFTRPVNIDKKRPAIILYTRPEERSYLCQRAFENHQNNHAELIALKDSDNFKKIEGFPRTNLGQLIESSLDMKK
jgi:hypothetical protein